MSVSFPRLPRWLCGGNSKDREKSRDSVSSLNTLVKKTKTLRKLKRGWIGRGGGVEEEKMGNVVFPEPDEPEWSIGWVEPHGPSFNSDDGFVVLVPCYKKVIPNGFFTPGHDGKIMEQWLSSMGKL